MTLGIGPFQYNRFDMYESTPDESFWIEDEEGNIYEGKKDACYHKVKAKYDVWPSAYASGALVKCRKKGASNWGNSSKKEMFDEFGNEYVLSEGQGDYESGARMGRGAGDHYAAHGKAGEMTGVANRKPAEHSKNQRIAAAAAKEKRGHGDRGAALAKPFEQPQKSDEKRKKERDEKNARRRAAQRKANRERNESFEMEEGTVTPGADLAQRKLNKDANNSKLKVTKKIMEGQEQRMAMYSRALGVMGAHYSGQALVEKDKKAKEDYDGDGEVETSKEEYFGSKDKAIKKAMRKEEMKENRMAAMTAGESPMKMKPGARNAKITGGKTYMEKGKDGKPLFKEEEEVELTKDMVVEYLVNEGYASNEVSAEILHTHMSDEFLEEIEGKMISEMGPAYPSETKAQAKAQSDHRSGKSSAGLKTGKNPGMKMSHSSGANKQD